MKFTNGRDIEYKRVASLKKEEKCYFCEEKGHRTTICPKKSNYTIDKAEKEFGSSIESGQFVEVEKKIKIIVFA